MRAHARDVKRWVFYGLIYRKPIFRDRRIIFTRGIELKTLYKINFWDACILAAAETSKCEILLSEDLNTGQFYSGIRVQNPFVE